MAGSENERPAWVLPYRRAEGDAGVTRGVQMSLYLRSNVTTRSFPSCALCPTHAVERFVAPYIQAIWLSSQQVHPASLPIAEREVGVNVQYCSPARGNISTLLRTRSRSWLAFAVQNDGWIRAADHLEMSSHIPSPIVVSPRFYICSLEAQRSPGITVLMTIGPFHIHPWVLSVNSLQVTWANTCHCCVEGSRNPSSLHQPLSAS